MQECWRAVVGYEGYYEVSNLGNVKSIERLVRHSRSNIEFLRKGKLFKPSIERAGYLKVQLSVRGKSKYYFVHRLVAQAFLPNPDNLPEVNHKNEIKTDNNLDNLEWCSRLYNQNYGTKIERQKRTYRENNSIKNKQYAKPKGRSIYKYDLKGNLIAISCDYLLASSVEDIPYRQIMAVCNGVQKTCRGYIWKYGDI